MRRSKLRRPSKVLIFNGARVLVAIVRSLHCAAELMHENKSAIHNCCTGKSVRSGVYYYRQLHRLELEAGTPLSLCRDMFIFSYCSCGMAFVDIAYLKKSNLQNGMICYARRKTGQLLSVRIEPSIQRIIDRYISSNSPYIFPILTSLDAAEAYEQYKVALNTHNRLLGRLSEMLGCDCKLTSYTSRHSWATAARNHNVPISVISQGMGHTSEQTTQIYLTMLENSVIDDANKGIIGELL